MAITHTISQKYTAAGQTLGTPINIVAAAQTSLAETIGIAASDFQIAFSLDVSAVKSFYMIADRALTIETNDGGSPANTITLAANVPYIWYTGVTPAFVLTVDVTSLFVTNASGVAATLQIEALYDPTP